MPVIRTLDLRGQAITAQLANELVPRALMDITEASKIAAPVIDAVRNRGVSYIRELTQELDGFDPEPLRVAESELKQSLNALDPALRSAIELAISRNQAVSEAVMPKEQTIEVSPGALVTQRYQPVDAVGLYAPGGKAVYPSSVIMNAVPALVAKVPNIYLASPGQIQHGGRPHPSVLATAAILGLENVYCIGGPAAIAAFAYGLADVGLPAVNLITGPGNAFVAAAKRLVSDRVGIDSEAGTTEILVMADTFADPKLIASDLISQAEHDESAAAVLVTDSEALISRVIDELETQLEKTKHRDRVRTALSGQQSAILLVDSLDSAIDFANHYSTEHLEIMVQEPKYVADRISNAGAIFLGNYSPVSLGDYLAGSNHVLPTGGAAKFSSGLGVHTFLRPQQLISFSEQALFDVSKQLPIFANGEDLPAHGEAVTRRFDDN